jgi:hypothetical protein
LLSVTPSCLRASSDATPAEHLGQAADASRAVRATGRC